MNSSVCSATWRAFSGLQAPLLKNQTLSIFSATLRGNPTLGQGSRTSTSYESRATISSGLLSPNFDPFRCPHLNLQNFAAFSTAARFCKSRSKAQGKDRGSSSDDEVKKWSEETIKAVLGPTVARSEGNRLLAVLQRQRASGTLDHGVSAPGIDDRILANALLWLRANYPVDEDTAIGARPEKEELLEAEKSKALAEQESTYRPQQNAGKTGLYGRSGLEDIKDHYERKLNERREESSTDISKDFITATKPVGRAIVARRIESAEWVQRYKKKASLSDAEVPHMTKWQRLWPSGLFAISVIGLSILFAQNYKPPPLRARILPDIPPAAATIIVLIGMNTAMYLLWKAPPMWRTMNICFMLVPGLPVARSILGNIFSHQTFGHLAGNMVALWFIGTRLHDDIGRGNFLAIFLSGGVIASFTSLSVYVFQSNFTVSTLGASGALAAIMATWCLIHTDAKLSVAFIPTWLIPPISTTVLLSSVMAIDIYGVTRGWTNARHIDHWAHMGGYFAGIVSAQALNYRAKDRLQAEMERRKKLGFIDRVKEGRF